MILAADNNEELKISIIIIIIDAIRMIDSSWFKVSVETIVNCFSHVKIKVNLGETELNEKCDTNINKGIDESLCTIRDFFSSEAEMNGYLELNQDIQDTEDFSVESNDPKITEFLSKRLK